LPDPFLVGRGSLQACLQGALPGSTPDHVASRKDNIAMPIVTEHFESVIGVDTHAATHTLAVVTAASGAKRARATFPTSAQPGRRPPPEPGPDHDRAGQNAGIDPDTKTYVERRRAEGRTTKEIMRSLNRYVTRQLIRTLATAHPAT